MNEIPKVIHQIWSGIDEPLPEYFRALGDTWKENHSTWKYELWDEKRINEFNNEFYPQYWIAYRNFKYNIQRWDVIRYLILEKIGGLYVDFDYECISPLDDILRGKNCCFACEPKEHTKMFSIKKCFNNALMASVSNHPFMEIIVKAVFKEGNEKKYSNKMMEVLETTGPHLLTSLYEQYDGKEELYIIPEELVSPLTKNDAWMLINCKLNKEQEDYLEKKMDKAVAIHYFIGSWL